MLRILLALIALTLSSPVHAFLGPDPHRDWRSADSNHFRINYAASDRAQAERIADIAERVYARLSREMQWEPGGRIEIIVLDEFDVSNGSSTPLPFNESAIFLSPPNEGELLDNSIWLEMLLTHELTHTFHLDKVRGAPGVIRHILVAIRCCFPTCGSRPGPSKESPPTMKALQSSVRDVCVGRFSKPGCASNMSTASSRCPR